MLPCPTRHPADSIRLALRPAILHTVRRWSASISADPVRSANKNHKKHSTITGAVLMRMSSQPRTAASSRSPAITQNLFPYTVSSVHHSQLRTPLFSFHIPRPPISYVVFAKTHCFFSYASFFPCITYQTSVPNICLFCYFNTDLLFFQDLMANFFQILPSICYNGDTKKSEPCRQKYPSADSSCKSG